MKKHLLLLVTLMMMSSSAFANRLSVVGALNYNLDSSSASFGGFTATTKGGLGFGGGLLMGMGVFELGAIYLSKSYTTSITGQADTTTKVTGLQIPLMYRFGHSNSFGIGGFYELAMTTGYSALYGLTAGPRFGGMNGGMFLDLRFNYGFQSGGSKDALALIGYAFK